MDSVTNIKDSATQNIKDSATQLRELALIAGNIPLACKLLNIASSLEESAKNISQLPPSLPSLFHFLKPGETLKEMMLRNGFGGGGGGTWV